MTQCNRCKGEFDNFFNGRHWCPNCGMMFSFDENALKEEPKKKEKK